MLSIIELASPFAMTTGNDILEICDGREKDEIACLSWIAGVTSGIDATQRWSHTCVVSFPQGSIRSQYRDIVVQYLIGHPATRHLVPNVLALVALRDAYPCPTK